MRRIDVVLVGAGGRGFEVVGKYAKRFPYRMRLVAVAEPVEWRRDAFADEHEIPKEMRFDSWDAMAAKPKLADALFNMTGDAQHLAITEGALSAGYHVLLEKPIADTPEGCLRLAKLKKNSDRVLQLGLCLRFTPFFRKVKEILDSGAIGDVVTLDYQESITCTHMSHSFVRGNWSSRKKASPMIIAKSCHDLDMIVWLLGSRCAQVASFGGLRHFHSGNAPLGAPERCVDGCPYESQCPYSAIKMYVNGVSATDIGFGSAAWYVSPESDPLKRLEALKTSPYGRCVYRCDNDVVDHQILSMEFENGAAAAFTMQGFSAPSAGESVWGANRNTNAGRRFTFWGTKGVLSAPTYGHIELTDHNIGHTEKIQTGFPEGSHGGGDFSMIHDFLNAVESNDASLAGASLEESVHAHLIGFAAEQSRLGAGTLNLAEWSDLIKKNIKNK